MTEAEYERLRELIRKWYRLADAPRTEYAEGVGLRGCADDLKAVLDSFPEANRQRNREVVARIESRSGAALTGDELQALTYPEVDSCSTCGADPNEPCRHGCMYAARTRRGWREIPAPTKTSEQVLAELEALQQRRREGRG